jgi:Spy/CpxP family protein refolding chaperone
LYHTGFEPHSINPEIPMRKNWKISMVALALLSSLAAQATAQESADQQKRMDQRREKIMSNVWWNQPQKIESLSLTEEQRGKMDAHLEAYLDQRRVYAQDKDVYQSFAAALEKGDAEAAGVAREQVLENLAAPMRIQLDLMITATAELTAEQRKIIASEHPLLFKRPWVRMATTGARGGFAGRQGRKGGGGG